MKNLFKSVLLVGLFVASFSSEAFSQTITNNTDCTFRITCFYAEFGCASRVVTVPPNSVSAVLPAKISGALGAAVQLTNGPCPFKVGNGDCPSTGSDLDDDVDCGDNAVCQFFTATLDANTGSLTIE